MKVFVDQLLSGHKHIGEGWVGEEVEIVAIHDMSYHRIRRAP